jgi:hypothetical protein
LGSLLDFFGSLTFLQGSKSFKSFTQSGLKEPLVSVFCLFFDIFPKICIGDVFGFSKLCAQIIEVRKNTIKKKLYINY